MNREIDMSGTIENNEAGEMIDMSEMIAMIEAIDMRETKGAVGMTEATIEGVTEINTNRAAIDMKAGTDNHRVIF